MATKKATKKTTSTTVKSTTVKAVVAKKTDSKLSLNSLKRTPGLGATLAEFVGTFLLTGVVLVTRNEPIYVMFALIGIVLTVGVLSGSHVNPAITLGALITRKISALKALAFVVAQALGALLAFTVISSYVNAAEAGDASLGTSTVQIFQATAIPAAKEWAIFFAELLGLTIFGFVFASAFRVRRDRVAYSLTVGLGLFLALLISGAAAAYIGGATILNPAVAGALQAFTLSDPFTFSAFAWAVSAYVFAPVIGSVLGFFLYDTIHNESGVSVK